MKKNKINQIILRSIKLVDLNEYKLFISKYWKKDHIFVRNEKFFLWQHSFNKKKINSVCAFYKKKIIGSQNYIDFNQFDRGISKKQIFLGLWSAPTKSNFISIGFSIFKEIIIKEKPDFVGSIGLNSKTINFHKWQKFKVGQMSHHAFVSPYIDKFKIAKILDKSIISNIPLRKDIVFNKVNKNNLIDLNIDKLFNYQIPIKSKRYLMNRYLLHPIFNYNIYYHKVENAIVCLFVIREISINNSKILKIIDFIGHNKYFFKIKYLLNKLFKEKNYEYASLYSFGIPEYIFKKANFFNVDKVFNNIIPNYFSPYVQKNITINYGYKGKNIKNVRIFSADSDQDSPN